MLSTGSTDKLVEDRARLTVPGWLLAAGLLIVTLLIGPALGALSRPLFVVGCGAVGYYAWRQSAASHLQTALVLFWRSLSLEFRWGDILNGSLLQMCKSYRSSSLDFVFCTVLPLQFFLAISAMPRPAL